MSKSNKRSRKAPGRLIPRAIVGGYFIGHGVQKLFGVLGGHGLEATAAHFETIGLKPGKENAIAAGVAETAGGALLALGLLTPVAGAALVGTMVTAVRTVHLEKGPWLADGGFEYNLVLIAAVLAIVDAGKSGDSGGLRALLALAAGAAASTAVIEAGKKA
ncbi:MAG TPA: DoxX family protein [Solirubrobacteraceae bacterium]